MTLFFKAKEVLNRNFALTYDDVLLVPGHSEISSRRNPSLKSQFTKNYEIDIPIVGSNMDTISEKEMVIAMARVGAVAILHRFMDVSSQVEQVKEIRAVFEKENISSPIAASIGVKGEGKERAHALVDTGVEILTIDIAHGDSVMMMETLEYVKSKFPKVDVIAGNVATGDGMQRLIEAGADAVKVGIGPGSMCTTRIITGCGVPQITSISHCQEIAKKYNVPIISDGGVRTSGDIVKALSVGASTVMVGSLLAGTMETPGEIHGGKKRYRGMASKDAQVSWRGELPEGMAPEGEAMLVPCKGSVKDVINELAGGIRSGMTYINASTIPEMFERAVFVETSQSGINESRPHGLNR